MYGIYMLTFGVWMVYIYANIWGILMVNVTIYSIHGSYGYIYIYVKEHSISVLHTLMTTDMPMKSCDLQQFQSQFADLFCILVKQ